VSTWPVGTIKLEFSMTRPKTHGNTNLIVDPGLWSPSPPSCQTWPSSFLYCKALSERMLNLSSLLPTKRAVTAAAGASSPLLRLRSFFSHELGLPVQVTIRPFLLLLPLVRSELLLFYSIRLDVLCGSIIRLEGFHNYSFHGKGFPKFTSSAV
jgi:hypothetical protein